MATSVKRSVELGFVEKTLAWKLMSHMFPSKVGGKPAWLSLKPLPSPGELVCGVCGKPCIFLLQVYAPVNEVDDCFHRTLFVFICKDPDCSRQNQNKNFRVFRSQLFMKNEFYSFDPPDQDSFDENLVYPTADQHQSTCMVCGCTAPSRCAKCHKATYCDRTHQAWDWKAGHKQTCGKETTEKGTSDHSKSFLFLELEIVTESEEFSEEQKEEKTEKQKLDEFKKWQETQMSNKSVEDKELSKDLEKMAMKETDADKQFNKFKERIQLDPEQVLRYERGGEPLWVSSEAIPEEKDIPKCSCGAKRQFEFQILPQLLNHLDIDSVNQSIDWGTVAIFTCSRHCSIGNYYVEEFAWQQDFSKTDSA